MEILKTNTKGLLIVISGPSGAGKGTICNELIKNDNVWISTSMTTREPRGSEVNGKEYFFVTKEEFEKRIKENKFLEYAIVHNNQYYGTPIDKIEEKREQGIDVILEIDIQGALKVKEKMEEAICIFIMPPSMRILKDRLINRHTETKEKVLERFKKAYQEINEVAKYNYVVINDYVDIATKKVESIINAEKCRVDRIEEVFLNNQEEEIHEALVDMENKNEC